MSTSNIAPPPPIFRLLDEVQLWWIFYFLFLNPYYPFQYPTLTACNRVSLLSFLMGSRQARCIQVHTSSSEKLNSVKWELMDLCSILPFFLISAFLILKVPIFLLLIYWVNCQINNGTQVLVSWCAFKAIHTKSYEILSNWHLLWKQKILRYHWLTLSSNT